MCGSNTVDVWLEHRGCVARTPWMCGSNTVDVWLEHRASSDKKKARLV